MESNPTQEVPLAGEIWDAILDPIRGREQAGYRPVLILSNDWFNSMNGSIVIAVPITGTEARVRYQIEIESGEGGVGKRSTILPEQIRAMDISRLRKRRGKLSPDRLAEVRRMVLVLLTD